jgi:iron complex outermembrane receptor protein
MPETPRWKYTIAADYTVFLSSLPFDGNVGAFYRHQGPMHFDTFNDPLTREKGYGVLNLYAGLISHDQNYRVKLFLNNALDQQYYSNLRQDQLLNSMAGAPVIVGQTDRNAFRYAGISFEAKFK